MTWNPPRQFAAKNKVKLLLNLCLIAQAAIPRGGVISVDLSGQNESLAMRIEAKGPNPRLASGVADLIAGQPESGAVDAHSIQPYFAGLVARECGMEVAITVEADSVTSRPADRRKSVSRIAPVQSFLTSPRQDRRAAVCASTRGDAIGSRLMKQVLVVDDCR